MSKFNNKFSFYMLMFCGTGTIFNLALLNFGKWAPIELHSGESMAFERREGSKKY